MAQQSLEDWQWKYRVLILSVTDRDQDLVKNHINMVNDPGFADRDMKLVVIQDGVTYTAEGEVMDFDVSLATQKLTTDRNQVMLIGKDGGVKLLEALPVSKTRLFNLIDGMPMRRSEMKKKGKN